MLDRSGSASPYIETVFAAADAEGLQHTASEASEAYSDVFEEDMPKFDADDHNDVSDAASVKSMVMSVHSPSDLLEQLVETEYVPSYAQGKLHF